MKLTDQQIIAAMRPHLDEGDGGLHTQKVISAGKALLEAVDPGNEVDFLVRVLECLGTWRAEDWSEILERNPALLAMLRPLVTGNAPASDSFDSWWGTQDEGAIRFDLQQYPGDLKAALGNVWNAARASAPIAGEAQPAIGYLKRDKGRTEWSITRAAYDLPDGIHMLYAAPQASEAQCSCPSGDGSLRHPCAVHPQASDDRAIFPASTVRKIWDLKERYRLATVGQALAGYAGVTVWVGDKQCTRVLPQELMQRSSVVDALHEAFNIARAGVLK